MLTLVTWKAALCPVDYTSDCITTPGLNQCESLVNLCAHNIVLDASMTKSAVKTVPKELLIPLMHAAISKMRGPSLKMLIAHWPFSVLSVKSLAPPSTSLSMLYNNVARCHNMEAGAKCAATLSYYIMDCIKAGKSELRICDLRGFPVLDAAMKYLINLCIALIYKEEEERKKMIPLNLHQEDTIIIKVECVLRDMEMFLELYTALRGLQAIPRRVRLHICTLIMTCFGMERIEELLQVMDLEHLTGLCLSYNSLGSFVTARLQPYFEKMDHLTALDLSCNNIKLPDQDVATTMLANALKSLKSLKRLDLSNSRLTGRLRDILIGLPNGLEFLKLGACVLIEADVIYLSQSHHSRTLMELDLSENNLPRSINKLASLFAAMGRTLVALEMEDCRFTSSHVTKLGNALLNLYQLKYLNLSFNSFDNNFLLNLAHKFGSMLNLQAARLSYPMSFFDESGNLDAELASVLKEKVAMTWQSSQSCQKSAFVVIWADVFNS